MDRDYIKELKEYEKQQIQERKLTNEAKEILDLSMELYEMHQKVNYFEEVLDFFKKEKLQITDEMNSKFNEIEAEKTNIENKIKENFTHVLETLTHKKILTMISFFEKRELREKFEPLINLLGDEEKKVMYKKIREEKLKNQDNKNMVFQFEKRIGYNFDFVRKELLKDLDEDLYPFLDFFSRYVNSYDEKIKSTLNWLKEDVINMNLVPVMYKRYADATIRRLKIGENLEDKEEKIKLQKNATQEFIQLLKRMN